VFVTGSSLVGLARSTFVSRASLRVDPSRIDRVRVTASGSASGSAPGPVVKSASALRDAVSGFIADRVESLGEPDVGDVDLTIEIALADGGPTKKIVCSVPDKQERRKCATPDTRAVFTVLRATWSRLFDLPDGGNVARDAGSR
jgi:hypothetical protein